MEDIKVGSVMTRLVVTLSPFDSIQAAAQRLARNRISGAPVVEDDKVVGMLTESDILYGLSPGAPVTSGFSWFDTVSLMTIARFPHHLGHRKVKDIMTTSVATVTPDTDVWRAAGVMQLRSIKRLPVVNEDNELVGIVSRADLIKLLAKDDAGIKGQVLEAIGVLGEEVFDELDVKVEKGIVTIYGRADRKSTHDIALMIAAKCPGVVQVFDHLAFEYDDSHVWIPRPFSTRLDPRRNWNEVAAAGDPR